MFLTVRNRATFLCVAIIVLLTLGFGGCSASSDAVSEGMEAIQNVDYQTALLCFDEAEAAGENARLIARGRGIAYMGMTEYEQAITCFEEALYLSDGLLQSIDYDLNYYLAAAYTKAGRLEEAKETYGAILTMKPEETDALFLRGNVCMELGEYEEAQEDFQKVVELEPQNYDYIIQIYEVLDYYGYTQEGQSYLEAALEQGVNTMTAYEKGRIYYYLGEYQYAYAALEQAREEEGTAEAYLYLGRAYEATGDYNYAATVYNAYLAMGTADAEIYNQLGICEMAKGDYEAALSAFQTGMKVEGNTIMQALSFNEIVAYEYLGEYTKALVLMETYLDTYPDDTVAQREYAFLSTR